MPRRPLFHLNSSFHQRPPSPPLGRFNSPSPPPPLLPIPPPSFRPLSNAPILPFSFTPRRLSRAIVSLQHLPPAYYRLYVDRTVGNSSPVAARRGRTWRTPSASQPPNPRSPGRKPTSRTPDVTEVRQACQSQRQDERSIHDASFLDDASSTVEGFRSRKFQKSVSYERTHLKMLAVADDQEKEKQGQTSHKHQSTRGKKKAEMQTDQISISDYVGSTAGDEGYSEGKFQDLMITSEGVDHEGSFLADSQEAKQAQEINHSQPSPRIAKRQKDQTYTVEDASASEGGEIRERKLQKFMSSEKNELEAATVSKNALNDSACVVFGVVGDTIAERVDHEGSFVTDFQDKGSQERSQILMKNGPSTPGGDIMQVVSQELMSSVRYELEAPVLADSQEASQPKACNQSQPSPRKAKRQKDQVDSMEDDSSTSEGGEMRETKLQKLMSSEKNELEAASLPRNSLKDSAYDVLGEVENTVSPIGLAQMTSSFHDEADSCSVISSLFDWASTFDDVSSSGVGYWGSDETMVKVGNYFVDQKHATTMNAIMKRYGDIAKDCRYTSTMFRSYALQVVCEVVEGLQISLQQLSHDRLDKYSCFLKEAAEMGLTVKWLEERFDDVSDAIESLKEYKNVRDTRKGDMGKIEGLKKEIGSMVKKKMNCQNEIEGLKCLLEEARLEVRKKKSAIDDTKTLCKVIPKRLLDGLY